MSDGTLNVALGSVTGAPVLRSSRIRSCVVKQRSLPVLSRMKILSTLLPAPSTSVRAAASNLLAHASARATKSASFVLLDKSCVRRRRYIGSVVSGSMRSFTLETAATVAIISSDTSALNCASRFAEASSRENAPTRRKCCRARSSVSSATANELLSTMTPWQSGWSAASALSTVHAFLMSVPSPDEVISNTSVGSHFSPRPSSRPALAAASSRLARSPSFNGVEVANRDFDDAYGWSAAVRTSCLSSGTVADGFSIGTMSTPLPSSRSTCDTIVDFPAPFGPTTTM
mmetsp:Transcript_25290/g.81796  ORF Transcript_25290/g.81796 Transcript_25290/m.81796 type:complete len:287 (+) Transcript_25290:164-1024(+)